jgi:hypothetical protein
MEGGDSVLSRNNSLWTGGMNIKFEGGNGEHQYDSHKKK